MWWYGSIIFFVALKVIELCCVSCAQIIIPMRFVSVTYSLLLATLFMMPTTSKAQHWRLVKQVSLWAEPIGTQNYYMSDSTLYRYDATSTLGSTYNSDTIWYNQMFHYIRKRVGPTYVMELNLKKHSTYTADSQLATHEIATASYVIQLDTFFYWNNLVDSHRYYRGGVAGGSMAILELEAANKYTYDNNNRPILIKGIIRKVTGQPLAPGREEYFIRNANGQVVVRNYLDYDSKNQTWYDLEKDLYTYDANGNMILHELFRIDPVSKKLEVFYKKHFYYNAQNQLVVDSIGYINPNHNFYRRRHAYTYDAKGRLLTDTLLIYDPTSIYTDIEVKEYSYTSFGYIDEINGALGVTVGPINHRYKIKYTYEQYSKTLNVAEHSTSNKALTLYPNPATHVLHIKTNEAWQRGYIYSSLGQVVQEFAHTKQVSINNLPAGNYFIQLVSDGAVWRQSFVVVR